MDKKQSKQLFPFKSGENDYIFTPGNVSIYQVPPLYYEIATLWQDDAMDIQNMMMGTLSSRYDGALIGLAVQKLQTMLNTPPSSREETETHVPGLKEIHLQVSHVCNLNCKYCYAEGGNYGGPSLKMDQKTARQAVDYFLQSLPEGTVGDLSFDGGEPLTNWDIIQEVVDYGEKKAREQNKRLFFFIGTNGTLLNKSTHSLIKNKRLGVGISIDGDADTQDANRKYRNNKGSYSTLSRNIKDFISHIGNQNLQARSTITRHNLKVSETVKHLLSLNLMHLYLDPVSSTDPHWQLTPAELEIINNEFTLLADFYAKTLLEGKIFIIRNFYLFIKRLHFKKKLFYKCGVGRSGVAITPKGDIFPCYRFASVPSYRMGNIFEQGINRSFQQQFIDNRVDDRAGCNTCWARYLCGGGCPYHAVYKQGDIYKNDHQECQFLLHLVELSLQIYIRVKNSKPQFWDFFFKTVNQR